MTVRRKRKNFSVCAKNLSVNFFEFQHLMKQEAQLPLKYFRVEKIDFFFQKKSYILVKRKYFAEKLVF